MNRIFLISKQSMPRVTGGSSWRSFQFYRCLYSGTNPQKCSQTKVHTTFDAQSKKVYLPCHSHRTISSHLAALNQLNVPHRNSPLLSWSSHQFLAVSPSLFDLAVTSYFHTGPSLWKDSPKEESVVEKTVKALKDEEKERRKPKEPVEPEPASKEVAPAPKKSLGERFKDELKHYYHGFRLLAIDVKVAGRLVWRVLNGVTLSRRERRQLVRTTADLFRLVPFLVMVLIPFLEFFLPVFLKLFPNMLPSTFAIRSKEEEKMKNKLKVKLEMAKFLQDTIEASSLQKTSSTETQKASQEFADFMSRVRSSGSLTTNSEIVRFSKLFEDEITLDNMSRAQLAALCQVLEMPTLGTNAFLRFQLNMKLRQLMADDKMIQKEGIDSLNTQELQGACRSRGMKALGLSKERLQSQLQQWLDLHLNEQIPTSLLLLSRALYLPEALTAEQQIKATISALPESSAEEAKIKAAEVSGEKVDNKVMLERVRGEEEALRQEEAERREAEKREAEEKMKVAEAAAELAMQDTAPQLEDKAPVLEPSPAREPVAEEKEEELEIEKRDLEQLESVLETIASEKKMALEKGELEELKEDVEEYQEDLKDLHEVISLQGVAEVQQVFQESRAAQLLKKRVDKMITQMDIAMDGVHKERREILEDIEVREVRARRSDDKDRKRELMDLIEKDKRNVVSLNEVLLGMRQLQLVDSEAKLQRIVQVLDEDRDGLVDVDGVMKVLELLGRENVKLSAGQVAQIMTLIQQEEIIEEEEKRDKQTRNADESCEKKARDEKST